MTNCAYFTNVANRICLHLTTYSNNCINLIKSAIDNNANL